MRSSGGLGRLIPKSTGGRVALGAGGALGVAAGVSSYRNRKQQMAQAEHSVMMAHALSGIASGQLPSPEGYNQVYSRHSGNVYDIG